MDVFPGWADYVERLEQNWRKLVSDDDVVVIPGDISWEMDLERCKADFTFLDALPGQKLLLKGNHDYWWSTKKKLDEFLTENNFSTLKILFNNAYRFGDYTVVGTRGWFYDAEHDPDNKVLLREAGRLRLSVEAGRALGGELICFLHYPPVSVNQSCEELLDVLREAGIRRCYYGHLHGASTAQAVNDVYDGLRFQLVSADYLHFCPYLVEKI